MPMLYIIKKPLTRESILSYISEWDIFKLYIDNLIKPNTSFIADSDIRIDNLPSCRVTCLDKGWIYKDFSRKGVLNCFQYVMLKYKLTFMEALEKIRVDFKLFDIEEYKGNKSNLNKLNSFNIQTIRKTLTPSKISTTEIRKRSRGFTLEDKKFWFDRYGIYKSYLNKAKISPITHFWLKNSEYDIMITPKNLAYSYDYYWHKNILRRKIYQPFETDFKWFSNVDDTIIQGWNLLPKEGGDLLIITSSFKDVGTIYCNREIYAIAPNTESAFILPSVFYKKIRPRWKRIVIWYNNDYPKLKNTGIINAKKYAKEFDIEYIFQPDGLEKDPSDFRHKFGERNFIELTNTLLNI